MGFKEGSKNITSAIWKEELILIKWKREKRFSEKTFYTFNAY